MERTINVKKFNRRKRVIERGVNGDGQSSNIGRTKENITKQLGDKLDIGNTIPINTTPNSRRSRRSGFKNQLGK